MNYQQTLEFLFNSLPDYQNVGYTAYKPGLERTIGFNQYLGSPDSNFHSIHVAGTNGKGSVSHIIASVLTQAGYKVGLYTSPHLKDFRERIRVEGEMIPEKKVVEFVERHKEKMEELKLSFFEMTVGMAFDYFDSQGVEVAVIEAGLGGRLDSTNIINPLLSIITNIGFDHTDLLGDTIEKIATEKAGIIKKGVPVVIGESHQESDKVFLNKALEVETNIRFADKTFRCEEAREETDCQRMVVHRLRDGYYFDVKLDLLGECQRRNIVTVFAALDMLHTNTPLSISRRAALEGCEAAGVSTSLIGRWQVLGKNPLVVCDTGHNEHGLRIVTEQISRQKYDKLYMVVGFVNDKELSKILPLLPVDAHYIFTQSSISRALPAEELTAKATAFGLKGETIPGVMNAVEYAKKLAGANDMIFIGGSTFTVADIV